MSVSAKGEVSGCSDCSGRAGKSPRPTLYALMTITALTATATAPGWPRLIDMICRACREGRHDECREAPSDAREPEHRSWCDCQHKAPTPAEPATGAAGE